MCSKETFSILLKFHMEDLSTRYVYTHAKIFEKKNEEEKEEENFLVTVLSGLVLHIAHKTLMHKLFEYECMKEFPFCIVFKDKIKYN